MKHVPVLLNQVLEILRPMPGKFIIDGTVDGGGHATSILEKMMPLGKFLGVDWDREILEKTKKEIEAKFQIPDSSAKGGSSSGGKLKIFWAQGNYANLPAILENKKLGKADGLLLDLGFSSDQLESSGKGFSFLKDEPLIMRYASDGLSAAEVINSSREADLADIFWKYGDERMSRRIAKKIVDARKIRRILTTFDLVEVIKSAVPGNYELGRIHPATRIFQALRIYVNAELDNLENILRNLPSILKPEGVIAVISFHSLEDIIVKNYFRGKSAEGLMKIITKRPIVPDKDEIRKNPRSRSAKLRSAIINIPPPKADPPLEENSKINDNNTTK